MSKFPDAAAALGRLLIAVLFVLSGLSKIAAPAAIQDAIAHAGLPLPEFGYVGAIAIEVLGGALLITGLLTRPVAAVMAGFTLIAAVAFHNDFADQNQMIHFLKNIAIIGGLLQVLAFGPGRFSIDAMRRHRRTGRIDAPQPTA